MSVTVKGKRKATAGARVLTELSGGEQKPVHGQPEREKLHGATFEVEPGPDAEGSPEPAALESPVAGDGKALLDNKITELLDQLGLGFQADDATNFEKLTIARTNGPVLWDLKALVPHTRFKITLRERYPKVNYAKCNRWMFIAKHEAEVQAALDKYPEVAWGPTKMIDFIKGSWTPEEEAEDDEEDCSGYVREDHVEEEPLFTPQSEDAEDVPEPDATSPFAVGALNPDLAAAVEEHQQNAAVPVHAGATAGPVTQAVRTPARPARGSPVFRPAVNRTEFEVEVRIGFKLSVPEHVTAADVSEALRLAEQWTVGMETPFDYEMSEKGVVVGHVRPWATPAEVATQ